MKARCYNKNTNNYHRYGGRGIKVCDRWLKSFKKFYSDVGKRPGKGYSLDRIENNGNYEPDNCEWVTQRTQCRNTSRNTYINGVLVIELLEKHGIDRRTFKDRLAKGMSVDEALTAPVIQSDREKVIIGGVSLSKAEWGRKNGISTQVINGRIKRGWAAEKAVTQPTRKKENKS